MRKLQYIIIILVLTFTLNNCYAQKETAFLDSIIQKHIRDFKNNLNDKDANVYVILRYDFTDYKVDKVKFVEPTLDARYLENKANYLVQFTMKNNKLVAVNFKVINKGKRQLELINMMNGKDYEL